MAPRRRQLAVSLAAVLTGAALVASASAAPNGPSAEQTRPTVAPAQGHSSTAFVLRLTAREQIGVNGVVSSDYRVRASRVGGGCASQIVIAQGARGSRLRVRLPPPRGGWCAGRYKGTVLLERGPYCPKGGTTGPPQPCPLFASQQVTVGRFGFRVA